MLLSKIARSYVTVSLILGGLIGFGGMEDSNAAVAAPPKASALPTSIQPTSVYPPLGKTEVVVNDQITASFAGLKGYSNISISSLTLTTAGVGIDGAVKATKGAASFAPSVPLQYNKTYTAEVSATMLQISTGRVVSTKYSWKFTTINPNADWIVFYKDFNDESPKRYTEQDLRNGWNLKGKTAGVAEGRVSVVRGSVGNTSNVMQIRYPARTRGLAQGGVQWRTVLPKHNELYVSYWVKFGPGFNFVKGGKIHGLAGGTANTGGGTDKGAKPTGYDGWSARMMWRPKGAAVQYVYHPDQPNTSGQDFAWSVGGLRSFKPGTWHKVETRIKMNTPGKRDGIVQAWFDGKLALDRRNVRFRNVSSLAIDQLLFCTIFGGSDATWATTKQEFSYFDNFIVSTRPITH